MCRALREMNTHISRKLPYSHATHMADDWRGLQRGEGQGGRKKGGRSDVLYDVVM